MSHHKNPIMASGTGQPSLSVFKTLFAKKPLARAIIVVSLMSPLLVAADAMARAGQGRSSGRSMNRSAPRAPLAPRTPQASPPSSMGAPGGSPSASGFGNNGTGAYRQPPQQPMPSMPQPSGSQGGGFLRNMGGAVAGGFLGSMLFSGASRAFNGTGLQPSGVEGGVGGVGTGSPRGGIGILEILLMAGLGYLGYRFWKSRQVKPAYGTQGVGLDRSYLGNGRLPSYRNETTPFLSDPSIGTVAESQESLEAREEQAEHQLEQVSRDIFYRIQTAWSRRDLTSVGRLMTSEMRSSLTRDLEELIRDKKFNRLENISITNIDILKSWEEAGETCCSVKITAYMLDYTLDEITQQVLKGSQQDPVRFQEIWTFSKPLDDQGFRGAAPAGETWVLSGIEQVGGDVH